MAAMLKAKEPFGTITGAFEGCPDARYVQNGRYFNAQKKHCGNADGTPISAPEDAPAPPPKDQLPDLLLIKGAKNLAPHLINLSDADLARLLTLAAEGDAPKTMLTAIEFERETRLAELG